MAHSNDVLLIPSTPKDLSKLTDAELHKTWDLFAELQATAKSLAEPVLREVQRRDTVAAEAALSGTGTGQIIGGE